MTERESNLHHQEIVPGHITKVRDSLKVHEDGEGADLVEETESLVPPDETALDEAARNAAKE
jgi:hypothetical protein